MQLYVSDFVGDTLSLSTEQIGAYMLLLMAMWNAGGSLPDDDAKLARVARLSLKKWRAIGSDLLTFFERGGGEIGHKRLTRELRKAQVKSVARAEAGARGGAATALKTKAHGEANAGALPRHLPESRNQMEKAGAFSPDENAQQFSAHREQTAASSPDENAQRFSTQKEPNAGGSPSENAQRSSRKKPSGWHQPKTHADAANAIIEEIARHDRSRIAAGDEGAGSDVLLLPAIRAD